MKRKTVRLCVVFSFVLTSPAALGMEVDTNEEVARLSALRQEDPTYARLFERSFPDAYREILVGQEITVPAQVSAQP